MLFPVHFPIGVDAAEFVDQSFKRRHKVEPGFLSLKYLSNVFAKRDSQQNHCNVHEDNACNFSVHDVVRLRIVIKIFRVLAAHKPCKKTQRWPPQIILTWFSDFFEVINCFKKEPEYDNEAYYIGDSEDNVHFVLI